MPWAFGPSSIDLERPCGLRSFWVQTLSIPPPVTTALSSSQRAKSFALIASASSQVASSTTWDFHSTSHSTVDKKKFYLEKCFTNQIIKKDNWLWSVHFSTWKMVLPDRRGITNYACEIINYASITGWFYIEKIIDLVSRLIVFDQNPIYSRKAIIEIVHMIIDYDAQKWKYFYFFIWYIYGSND